MSTALFDPLKTQSKITDSVLVAFSGGKESVVVLDLCFKYFKRVQPFFMYIVPGLSFEERTLEWYEKRYQTEIIRIPHNEASVWLHYGFFCQYDEYMPLVSSNDIYNYMRIETGIEWIAGGERIADSMWRRAFMKKASSIDMIRRRIFPVIEWKKQDIYDYIKFHHLYLGEDSKALGFSFRSLQGNELVKIKALFPDDYKKILSIYPFAEASVRREELKNGKK